MREDADPRGIQAPKEGPEGWSSFDSTMVEVASGRSIS